MVPPPYCAGATSPTVKSGATADCPAETTSAWQTTRPAARLTQPAGRVATATSLRKSTVTSTLCASLFDTLARPMPSVNGSPRSCRAGAVRLTSRSGSVETVRVSEAVLFAGLLSVVLLVTVAVMVIGPAVAGDGIGPEVIAAGMRILERLNDARKLGLEFVHFNWNADEYLRTGVSMPPGAMDDLRDRFAAVYLGAFGDPRIPDMKHAADILLGMRFQLDLYVNYRPVKLLSERLCPLKGKSRQDIDFVIFRENTEGAYVGMGGHFKRGTSDEIAIQEDVSTRKGVERIIRHAFEYARKRGRKSVCMSDKNNVMRFGGDLWLRTFEEVAAEYPGIEHFHMFVDALTMQMVRAPEMFEVIVTNNMFGDIVTDVCGGIGGFVNALNASDLHLPHRQPGNVYSRGWIGNVIIGAVAALVLWGLYGPMAKVELIGEPSVAVHVSMTFADVAGAI